MFSANLFVVNAFYNNSIDPYIPELWAQESLAILEENMVIGNLVHRDFEDQIASFGDVVNTRRPGEFVAKRKGVNDDVTNQDATATNVAVPLDQLVHVSFLIRDGEESKSFKGLVEEYMAPAMLAQARFIDQILLGQYPQFMNNGYGKLLTISSSNGKDFILATRGKMNTNKAYMQNRNMILTPNTETELLKMDLFVQAQQVGDDGTALREAYLGRKFGFNMYMCQNMASVLAGNTVVNNGLVNNGSGYPAGTTTMTVDTFNAAIPANSWFTVAGDETPQRVISTVGGATPTSITFSPGLRYAVVNDAVITRYVPGAVNQSSSPTGYAAGYAKEITVDGFTVAPQVGQLLTFGTTTTSPIYTIIGVNGLVGITLDRPLDEAIADDAAVNIGPAGSYNLAFHKNALALVTRPLATPRAGTGALSSVVSYNGLSVRVVITYDGKAQGHRVTLDMLCGIKVLDTNLAAVMFG